MQVRRVNPAVIAAAVGIIGACVAGVVAINTADRFVSKGTMNVRRAATAKPDDVMPRLAREAFNRNTLTGIIEKYDLYRSERAQATAEDVIHHMRGDIGIQLVSPNVFQVSFASSDGRTAQQVGTGRAAGVHQLTTSHAGGCQRVRRRSAARNRDRVLSPSLLSAGRLIQETGSRVALRRAK
jgi:dienelactone hydrolase